MSYIHVDNFNPKGKSYYYTECTEDFCYKTRMGVCSLDLTEKEAIKIESSEKLSMNSYWYKANAYYCWKIYKYITEVDKCSENDPVKISLYNCGHHIVDEGQHRICVSSKMELKLVASVGEKDTSCYICSNENRLKESIRSNTPQKTIIDKILRRDPESKCDQYVLDTLYTSKEELSKLQLKKDRDFRKF